MKAYMILAAQNSPVFGLGFADVEFVCSSMAKAMREMDIIIEQLNNGTLYWNDPERPVKHILVSDEKPDYSDKIVREIVIDHILYGSSTGKTYYRLVEKRVNDGLHL